ncbi:MAG: metal ABC transporter solute-binding protein, Zn/Mn family [Mycobacterium sp.]|jgi:zinc/manganese transport system substrate-binding protein|uniref:metal ABC transporter solute-binding protein, Zn/Mn family n=1 Tax=Mycobacterium sp. TaxID=1785 RepID=UPI00389A7457
MRAIRTAVVMAMSVGLVTGVAGCGQQQATDDQKNGTTTVVASTDVWGSVARAVAGDQATVKSIVNSAVDDPHSFEASPADAAAVADASLVVYNGGGYDHWVDDMLSGHPGVITVNAYSLLPGTVAQPANEHVFYDPATAKAVATQIADRLAKADASHADAYRANAVAFGNRADEILQIERAIGQTHPGTSVVATEPVAHYLLVNAGITDKTPEGFTSAVEEDADPAPADLAAMLDLINTHQVSALLFNPQTQTAVTKQIQDAAQRASVPVVTVTETLPNGADYLTWQRQTAKQLASQLDKAPQTNR